MNKALTGLVVLIVGVLIIGGIILADKSKSPTPESSTDNTNQTSASGQNSADTNNDQNSSTSNQSDNNKVTIKDNGFSPATITVKKGTIVTWTNEDSVSHDITPDNQSSDFKKSDTLSQGDSYEFTFNTVGTYTYHCSIHPFMKGTITVTE